MRHRVDGRKFGRNTSHRLAMFRNLANSVITKEQVVTTVQKAKEARRVVDRLITLGKSGSPASKRLAFDRTRDQLVVNKLFSTLAERYKTRAGGYTRILKMADRRWGDAAEMAVIELVDRPELDRKRKAKAPAEGAAAAAGGDPLKKMKGAFQPKKAAGEKKAKAPKAEAKAKVKAKAAASDEAGEAKSAAAKKPAAKKKAAAKPKAKSKSKKS